MKLSDLWKVTRLVEEIRHERRFIASIEEAEGFIISATTDEPLGVGLDDALRAALLANLRRRVERNTKELAALGVDVDEPPYQRVVGLDADKLDGTPDEQTAAKAAGEETT